MGKYIGVKVIHAEPAIRKGGKVYLLNESIPKTMDIVEEGYKVVYPDGYESFSPQKVFVEAYRKIENMTFGLALEAAKKGLKIARQGWNGQGMWVVLQNGYPNGIAINTNTAEATGFEEGTIMKFRPYFILFTAQKDFAHWVPSGSDILAEDWMIVE